MWRFHESCFLDKYTALAAWIASKMLCVIAGTEPPSDQLLAQDRRIPAWWRPWNGWSLYVIAAILAVPLDLCRPETLKHADVQNGSWPLSCDWLDMLDTVAILPQFAKFQRHKKKSEDPEPDSADSSMIVSDILGTYMAIMALARLLSFLSGVANIIDNLRFGEPEGPFLDTMECFYCFCSGINLALLGHFLYHYALSVYRGRKDLFIPGLCAPALQDKLIV